MVVHGLGQLNVAKVAGTIDHAAAVRGAHRAPLFHRAHTQVGQTASLGQALLVRVAGLDFGHRVPTLCWLCE